MNRFACVLVSVLSCLVFASSVFAQADVRVVQQIVDPTGLPLSVSQVHGVSNNGDFVGFAVDSAGLTYLAFHVDAVGEVRTYSLPDELNSLGMGINNAGNSTLVTNQTGYRPHLYSGGTYTDLSTVGGVVVRPLQLSATAQAMNVARIDGGFYRWRTGDGWQELGAYSGRNVRGFNDISDDGSVSVGYVAMTPFVTTPREAAIWDSSGTAHVLGLVPGYDRSVASFVSADGSTVMGYGYRSSAVTDQHMFRWTESEGLVPFNFDNGLIPYLADSSLSTFVFEDTSGNSMLWSDSLGYINVNQLLIGEGLTFSSLHVSDISPDGHSIAGIFVGLDGFNRGFSATLTVPAPGAALTLVGSLLFARRRRR